MHTVVQAEFVDPNNVGTILFPENIDPNQRTQFGCAESILPRSFLLERGASGESECTHTSYSGVHYCMVCFLATYRGTYESAIMYIIRSSLFAELNISAVNIRMDNIDSFLPNEGLE